MAGVGTNHREAAAGRHRREAAGPSPEADRSWASSLSGPAQRSQRAGHHGLIPRDRYPLKPPGGIRQIGHVARSHGGARSLPAGCSPHHSDRKRSVRQGQDPHQARRHRRRATGRAARADRHRRVPTPWRRRSGRPGRRPHRGHRAGDHAGARHPGGDPRHDGVPRWPREDRARGRRGPPDRHRRRDPAPTGQSLRKVSDLQVDDRGAVESVQGQIEFLSGLRDQVDRGETGWSEIQGQYFIFDDALQDLIAAFGAGINDPELATRVRSLGALARLRVRRRTGGLGVHRRPRRGQLQRPAAQRSRGLR